MAVRVMVGATAASVAQRFVTQADSFHTAVQRLTAAADALANQASWNGAAAQQFRAERRVLAAHAQSMSAALQRVAHAAASLIETIDNEDAHGMDGVPQQQSATGPHVTPAAYTTASSDDSGGGWLGDVLGSIRSGAEIVTGGALMALGAGGEATGGVLDASGVALPVGIALNVGSAVAIAGGADLAANGAVGLGHHLSALASDNGGGGSGDGGGGGSADDGYTHPSHDADPNAQPGGTPTKIEGSAEKQRGLKRENESADILAKAGYDVEQNPTVPGPKEPDYRIEGRIFDNYAPKTGNPKSIATEIRGKVSEGQADRIVLNLSDSPVDTGALSERLQRWPIRGLKEVMVIDRDGNIVHLYP
ncbi:hypothetical protein ACIQVL_50835 [Streptomyces sp. NPDC090499]|uniref:CdiA C-terminal domain-containing protein n=1 Tax=Streptomyces sp. NPDC090499 TaxID=3365965 RepID=UPI0037FA9503